MDPALHELLAESAGSSEDELELVVRLADGNDVQRPPGLRIISQFGSIATCRLPRSHVAAAWESEAVVSLKAPRLLSVGERLPEAQRRASEAEDDRWSRRPAGLSTTGHGVVVGIVDWGFDFAHPNFRNADGSTRFLALWDQTHSGGEAPQPYGYGRAYFQADIDRALTSAYPYEQLGYHPGVAAVGREGTHGTHVLDIAAGNGRLPGSALGVAPCASLVAVHMASRGTGGLRNLGDSVTLLEALDWICRVAAHRPLVINLSVGRHGGPHTGLTLVEQAIDALVQSERGRCIVQSAGNYYASNTHASGRLAPAGQRSLRWLVSPDDETPNELELWYAGSDRFEVVLTPPGESRGLRVRRGERADIVHDGRRVGRLYHRADDPGRGDHHVDIFLDRAAPAGEWRLQIEGVEVSDGRYHCWVERDSGGRFSQSRLHEDDANSYATTGTICNGFHSITVGAFDGAADGPLQLASFSSSGPTADGRLKPDLIAPGVRVCAARSTTLRSRTPQPGLMTQSGTSMAAPHVAGAIANMFEAAGRLLSIGETRALLLGNTSPAQVLRPERARVGNGRLDVVAAVSATARWVELPQGCCETCQSEMHGDELSEGMAMHDHESRGRWRSSTESHHGLDIDDGEAALLDLGGRAVDPATLFDALCGFLGPRAQRFYERSFEVVAFPGEPWSARIEGGDALLERALGLGPFASFEAIDAEDDEGDDGEDAERRRRRRRGRRSGRSGRLRHNQAVVRRRGPKRGRRRPAPEWDDPRLTELSVEDDDAFMHDHDDEAFPEPMAVPPEAPVPFAPNPPAGSYWPLATRHRRGREVNYLTASGENQGGNPGRQFLARRSSGARHHAGIDLFANFGDRVVAICDGRILAFYGFCCGETKTTYALMVDHGSVVVNYGEVAPDSLRRLGLAVGSQVVAGQTIGTVGRNPGGSSMLHLETYAAGTRTNLRWPRGERAPAGLRNPTAMLLWLLDHGRQPGSSTAADSAEALAASPEQTTGAAAAPRDWTAVSLEGRFRYVMGRLVTHYGYPVNGAAGIVGNLYAESGVLPNRLEGSHSTTPMRARDFGGTLRDFTADQIMDRSYQARRGPRRPGVGLAQWTSTHRRAGLFRHSYDGRTPGSAVLFDMDAQLDYLVHELRTSYRRVDSVLRGTGVSVNDASDEVVYRFEVPGAILTDTTPRRKRPRADPAVQEVFRRRRAHSARTRCLPQQRSRDPRADRPAARHRLSALTDRAGLDEEIVAGRGACSQMPSRMALKVALGRMAFVTLVSSGL